MYENQNIIVTLNKFEDDTIEDINIIKEFVEKYNIPLEQIYLAKQEINQ